MRPFRHSVGHFLSEHGEDLRQRLLATAQEGIAAIEENIGTEPTDEVLRLTLRDLRVWAARLQFLESPRRRTRDQRTADD